MNRRERKMINGISCIHCPTCQKWKSERECFWINNAFMCPESYCKECKKKRNIRYNAKYRNVPGPKPNSVLIPQNEEFYAGLLKDFAL